MARDRPKHMAGILVMAVMVVAVVVLRLYPQAPRPLPVEQSPPTRLEAPATARPSVSTGFGASIGFRTRERLREHFEKHGAEFRAADQAEYLAIAQSVRDAEVGPDVLESVRADGVVSRFDRRSGTFVAFNPDGILRTCFKPNDGERYFVRQARRGSR